MDSTQTLRWLSDYKDFLLSENKRFPVTPGELKAEDSTPLLAGKVPLCPPTQSTINAE